MSKFTKQKTKKQPKHVLPHQCNWLSWGFLLVFISIPIRREDIKSTLVSRLILLQNQEFVICLTKQPLPHDKKTVLMHTAHQYSQEMSFIHSSLESVKKQQNFLKWPGLSLVITPGPLKQPSQEAPCYPQLIYKWEGKIRKGIRK